MDVQEDDTKHNRGPVELKGYIYIKIINFLDSKISELRIFNVDIQH